MARSESTTQRLARLGLAQRPPHTPHRWVLINFVGGALIGVLFPRRLRWGTRGGPWAMALKIAANALAWLAMDALARGVARGVLAREEVAQRLRAELGRPPWPEELDRALR
jgi:hypothetical protein